MIKVSVEGYLFILLPQILDIRKTFLLIYLSNNLAICVFRDNLLKTVPEEIGKLKSLSNFDLHSNQVKFCRCMPCLKHNVMGVVFMFQYIICECSLKCFLVQILLVDDREHS